MPDSPHQPAVFQTFWYGSALSPYEMFCLRSFVDHGHHVDLYTYDHALEVPAGVTRRDAAEVLPQTDVFVYQHDGFGKGSPSAFSNVFRYQLLRDRGGWWIDTDVVCLTAAVPPVTEAYFARQDADFVAPGTMYFAAGHPVPSQCLEQVLALGRNVRWGDGGPKTFTRVLTETSLIEHAEAPVSCYPVHFTEALGLLRPERAAELTARLGEATFLHVWNSTLTAGGVDKHLLPPVSSVLRDLIERHPVTGWRGEYHADTFDRELALARDLAYTRQQYDIVREAQLRAEQQVTDMSRAVTWRITRPMRVVWSSVRPLLRTVVRRARRLLRR